MNGYKNSVRNLEREAKQKLVSDFFHGLPFFIKFTNVKEHYAVFTIRTEDLPQFKTICLMHDIEYKVFNTRRDGIDCGVFMKDITNE